MPFSRKGKGQIGRQDWPRGTSVFSTGPLGPCPLLPTKTFYIGQKMQNIMSRCVKSFSFGETKSPRLPTRAWPLHHIGGLRSPAPLPALSGTESLCFNLWLCFSNDVCSAPNSWRPEARIHGWITLTKMLVPICLYCLKCMKFGYLILRKSIKIVATRCQVLRSKCINFDFGWSSASHTAGSLQCSPRHPSCI